METLTEPAVEEREESAASAEAATAPPAEPVPAEPRLPARPRKRRFRALPWKTRLILATFGILLLVLGIAGLFLPFLQGIFLLVLAAAVLSLASERVYGGLRWMMSDRWPWFWKRVERFRTRVLWKFRR